MFKINPQGLNVGDIVTNSAGTRLIIRSIKGDKAHVVEQNSLQQVEDEMLSDLHRFVRILRLPESAQIGSKCKHRPVDICKAWTDNLTKNQSRRHTTRKSKHKSRFFTLGWGLPSTSGLYHFFRYWTVSNTYSHSPPSDRRSITANRLPRPYTHSFSFPISTQGLHSLAPALGYHIRVRIV